jgi:hypothetical protein
MLLEVEKYCRYLKRKFVVIGFLKIWVKIFIQDIYSWYLLRIFIWDHNNNIYHVEKLFMNRKIKIAKHNVNFEINIQTYKIYITNNYSIIFIQKYKTYKIYFAGLMFIVDI